MCVYHTKSVQLCSLYFLSWFSWWLRWWRICLQYRRPGFNPWVGKIVWRRECYPLQCSCLENSMDRGAWWKYNPWGRNKSDMTERLTYFFLIVVQLLSRVWLSVTPWTAARQASLPFTISQSLLKLMSIESVMPSNHLVLCHPFLLLPSIFPSIGVFSIVLALHILVHLSLCVHLYIWYIILNLF